MRFPPEKTIGTSYFYIAGGILFSSEDLRLPAGRLFFFRGQFLYLRQFAGGLFFFRRRKKNQERRHPFEWVDDDLGVFPPSPPPSIDGRPSRSPLLPALPCRPGETVLPQRETYSLAEKVHQADRFLFSAHFVAGSVARTPGPQGRAGHPGLERWPTGFLGLESRG